MLADVDEPALGVERDRARIPLPHAEPDRTPAALGCAVIDSAHEHLCYSAHVKGPFDSEPPVPHRLIPGDVHMPLPVPHLSEPGQRGRELGEKREHAVIANLT